MIVRKYEEIKNSERKVQDPKGQWTSYRFLLDDDKMGFSMHDTVIEDGAEIEMEYKNHLEAVYCVRGVGEIESKEDGQIHKIENGVLYALDKNDQHILRGISGTLRVICVFNPPLTGQEVHDEDGSYPSSD